MKKRLLCTILILNLIFIPCYHAYADAGTITIAGGTIGIGGLGAGALAGLAGPAVVAVFCGMLAVGMDIELTQASQQAGMTKTQFLKSKIEQYCQEANITAGVFYKGITDNMKITANGAIELGNKAGSQIKQFCNWLFNTNQVQTPASSSEAVGYINILGQNAPMVRQGYTGLLFLYPPGGDPYTFTIEKGITDYAIIICRNTPEYAEAYAISTTPFDSSNTEISITGVTSTYGFENHYGYYVCRFWGGRTADISLDTNNLPIYDGYVLTEVLQEMNGAWNPVINGENTNTFTGDEQSYGENSGALSPSNGEATVINPGLIGQLPIPADTDITVNVRDYLDALQDVIDRIQDRVIEGVDGEDGIPKDVEIPDEVAIDPTIGKDEPVPDSDSTPVTDEKPPDPETEPNLSSEPLKFDLKSIFPFCIPFDIKDMLAKLSSEPVAPNYHVDWYIPLLHKSLEFDINLACWNSVAAILRKMELLSFIVGLAVVTRNLIRG